MDTLNRDERFKIFLTYPGNFKTDDPIDIVIWYVEFLRADPKLYQYIKKYTPQFWINLAEYMDQQRPFYNNYIFAKNFVNPLWGLISVIIKIELNNFRSDFSTYLEYRFVKRIPGKNPVYLIIRHNGRSDWDITLSGPKKAQKMITGRNDVDRRFWHSEDFKAQNIYRLFRTGWEFVWPREEGKPHYIASHCIVCTAPAANICSHCNEAVYCDENCQKIDWGFHSIL